MIYYQDTYCYYFWKPSGIASTFGKQFSFLDKLLEQKEKSGIVQSLFAFFGKEEELGLLNRLDNETSGLLYFAKTPRVFHQFKTLQASSQLYKYYVAEVYGDMSFLVASSQQGVMGEAIYTVRFPMVHHKYAVERMVAIRSPRDLLKAKGFPRSVMTEILEVQVLKDKGTSIVLVRIHKGFRHQIRVHLATLGYPICGDYLYAKSKHTQYDKLQLFSIGLETLV